MSVYEQLPPPQSGEAEHPRLDAYNRILDTLCEAEVDPMAISAVFPAGHPGEGLSAPLVSPHSISPPWRGNVVMEVAARAQNDPDLPIADLRRVTLDCIWLVREFRGGDMRHAAQAVARRLRMQEDQPELEPSVFAQRRATMLRECDGVSKAS